MLQLERATRTRGEGTRFKQQQQMFKMRFGFIDSRWQLAVEINMLQQQELGRGSGGGGGRGGGRGRS